MTASHARTTTTLYSRIAHLPLQVDAVGSRQRQLPATQSWTRITTEVQLRGSGHEGLGEDATYSAADQRSFPAHLDRIASGLAGTWTLGEFCDALSSLVLFPAPAEYPEQNPLRRWALESAALDLALRQAGTSLAAAFDVALQPVRFCLSMSLGDEPSAEPVLAWLRADAGLEFKLDATPAWSVPLMRELAATGAVRVIDLKAYYRGDWVDNRPDPQLYARIAACFPDVLIEDALIDAQTYEALGDAVTRLSWDAPIHSLDDVRGLEHPPAAINIKPSRFGSLQRLLETIEWCLATGVPLYGGGQYELGVGRLQAQEIASIFYAGQPNDVAPSAYHQAAPGDGLPTSPLPVPAALPGFGREPPARAEAAVRQHRRPPR